MVVVPISLGQRQVATSLGAGLADPAAIIAITGAPGLGKSFIVEAVIRELGLTAWVISPAVEEMSARLVLVHKARSVANFVLVIEDAHTLPVAKLMGLFALLTRDRGAFPRLVFVARPSFWQLFDDPALSGARDLIGTVAVLFPMDAHESEQFLRYRLGASALPLRARSLLLDARGNPRLLCRAVAHHARAPARTPRPRRWSVQALSGSAALLVLALAVALLVESMTDVPLAASLSRMPPLPQRIAAP